MREITIARNYAEALFALAQKSDALREWGELLLGLADAMTEDRTLRRFLESPRVDSSEKVRLLGRALEGQYPPLFVRYLQALVRNRRQMLIPEIAREYLSLVDEAEGRLHAAVTTAREPDQATRDMIARELSRTFGKSVVPHFTVNAQILGGVVVRVGDRVLDGSVRRRLDTLRTRMLARRI